MKQNKSKLKITIEIVSFFLFVTILISIASMFGSTKIIGDSMEPTLKSGESTLVLKKFKPKRGDVVVFKAPDKFNRQYVKRIIGIPGDEIKYKDRVLTINGKKQDENYILNDSNESVDSRLLKEFSMKVPKDEYVVFGDNRNLSNDSRIFGTISKESLVGKVEMITYPLSDFSFVK